MGSAGRIDVDLAYLRQLIGAGWEGVSSAHHESGGRIPPLTAGQWKPAAAGAALGLIGAGLLSKRRGPSVLAVGGLAGSIVGLGAALAWASRQFAGTALRGAAQRVNAARDAHWLAMNPIDYA